MAIVSCARADGIAISEGDAMAAVCTFMNVLLSTAGSPLALAIMLTTIREDRPLMELILSGRASCD